MNGSVNTDRPLENRVFVRDEPGSNSKANAHSEPADWRAISEIMFYFFYPLSGLMFTTCLFVSVSFINGLYSAVITLADVFSPADQLSLPARYVRQPGQRSTLQVWHRRFSWNISGTVVTTFAGAVWKGHSWDFPSGYHVFVSHLWARVVLFLIDHHTVPYLTNVYGFLTLTMLFFSPKPNVNLTTW